MPTESRNPANDDTLIGVFREILKKNLQQTDDLIPARVVSFDRDANRVTVQPMIQIIDTDGNHISRAQQTNMPVLLMGGGDFLLSFNLPAGSLGWIKSSDRDLSLFLREYQESPPNTYRLHSFEDGLFIPDVMTGVTFASEDSAALVIQNKSGTVRISLNDDRIKLTAPLVDIAGNLNVSGTIVNGSINLTTHNHTQPIDSGGNVEQPTSTPQS